MPDMRSLPRTLIRGHLETLEKIGFRLEFIPMKIGAGMTPFYENRSLRTDTKYITQLDNRIQSPRPELRPSLNELQ
jgi:hypothetical protein